MASRRTARIGKRGGRALALATVVGWLGSSQLAGCMFPDYQTAPYGFVPGGGGGGSASQAGGGQGASSAAGSAGAGSGGVAQAGAQAQAGTSGTSGASGAPAEAGATGVEPLGGAGGAAPDSGILLFDDFEDQNDAGWFPTSGDWEVGSDGSSQVYRIVNLIDASLFSVIGDLAWTDVVVEAKVKVLEWGGSSSADLVGLYARFESPANHYYVALRGDGKLAIRKKVNTNVTLGLPVDLALVTGKQYKVKFELIGSELKAYLDDVLQVSASDSELSAGRIALGADFGRAEFDDVRVSLPQ